MEVFGNRLPSLETVCRMLGNLAQPEREKRPLAAAFYITFACNADCNFCSQSDFVRNGKKDHYGTNYREQLDILRLLRKDVPNIFFIGGEPTVHGSFRALLEESVKLEFDTIGVNTNGFIYRPEILERANLLVTSLHSVDPVCLAERFRVEQKVCKQAVENIKRYAFERDRQRVHMVINCVVTGSNIADAYNVAEFSREVGVQFNVAPAILKDGNPDPSLVNNPDYHSLIDWLISQNGLMAASRLYLRKIRNFQPFSCVPNVIPGIYPNGDVVVPCPNLGDQEIVNLMDVGGLNKAIDIGRKKFEQKNGVLDTQEWCAEKCHKACYIEGSAISTFSGLIDFASRG